MVVMAEAMTYRYVAVRGLYCSSVPPSVPALDSSGGITVALATLSSVSRSRSLTPEVERPAERTLLVSMRMILPNWLMTIISVVSSTKLMAVTGPILGVVLHVDDALAAAGLEAVGVDVGALAVAVFGDREDEAGGEAQLFVELGELGDWTSSESDGSGDGVVGAGELEGLGGGGLGGFVEDALRPGSVRPAAAARARRSLLRASGAGIVTAAPMTKSPFLSVDAAVAVGGAAHGAEVLLVEADGHAVVGGEEDDLLAVGDRAVMSSSSLSMPMAMMPRAMTLEKSLSAVFLTVPLRVAKRTNLPSSSRSRTGRMVTTFSPGWRSTSEAMALPLPAAPTSGIS